MRVTATEWETFLAQHQEAHLLQTTSWGMLKSEFGWEPVWLVAGHAGAQVLFRHLPLGFSLAYIPKGPVGRDWFTLWPEVDVLCHQKRAVLLIVEPDLWMAEEHGLEHNNPPPVHQTTLEALQQAGFRPGVQSIQPRRTMVVGLQGSEEDILTAMKQKTRYNIRLAAKKGVTVRFYHDEMKADTFVQSDETTDPLWHRFYELMQATGRRDDFGVHALAYYYRAYELFQPTEPTSQYSCALLLAEFEGQLLAALMIFGYKQRAWYLYGASSDSHRNLMPTYLLQWEAMRWARRCGCTEYDLWGVPDEDEAILEANFETRHDGLWGVYRFKRGFGGQLRRSIGAWERVYIPALYSLYRRLV
jgi:peptidoglycan pentaglycine glycine transferase (the first glycine)